jgi:hypothetical protein
MTPRHFIPVSEKINLAGYTPDPENPERPDLPEIPGLPFEEIPELELPGSRQVYFPCRLSLKQGCYQIRMTPAFRFPAFPLTHYKGTMRVEKGADHTTISGDLYRFKPLFEFELATLTEILTADIDIADGKPRIPIYPRKRYYSYLKVIKIEKSLFVLPHRPCKITLTIEEYRYTHPAPGDETGSFPETPGRVLKIVLQRIANPEGYPGPSFTGKVYHNGVLLSYDFSMLWVSDYYRRAKVELESVTGAAIPPGVGTTGFRSIYATAGWDLKVVTGNTNLPVPAGTGSEWTNGELHEFMMNNRNPATDLDKEWRFYYAAVPLDSSALPGAFGIMFDQLEDHREGACNFIDNFDSTDFDDNRSRLRSAAHEIGHGFNQLHPPTEDLLSDNSIMSQSGAVRNIIIGNGGVYPDDINFSFNEHNRHHLIHSPDVVVRPGGEDFEFGHDAGFAPEAEDNADTAGLQLRLQSDNDRLKLGEPLTFTMILSNNGKKEALVPKNIGLAFHSSEILVSKKEGTSRLFRSFVIVCDSSYLVMLKPGDNVSSKETVYWDSHGFVFQSPGLYNITASVKWDDGYRSFSAKASEDIWVDFPVTDKDNQVASLLFNKEVGKYVALGGNAPHLKEAVSRIEKAEKLSKEHPAISKILKINESGKKYKTKK